MPISFKKKSLIEMAEAENGKRMHNQHAWTERTPEGEKREVRAVKFGKQWKLQSKLRGAETWTYYDPAETADLETLLEILRRKYQRRRASWEDVLSVERLLKEAAG